jgi:hypothetical protein
MRQVRRLALCPDRCLDLWKVSTHFVKFCGALRSTLIQSAPSFISETFKPPWVSFSLKGAISEKQHYSADPTITSVRKGQ